MGTSDILFIDSNKERWYRSVEAGEW